MGRTTRFYTTSLVVLAVGTLWTAGGCTWLREATRKKEKQANVASMTDTSAGMTEQALQRQLARFATRLWTRLGEQVWRMMPTLDDDDRVQFFERALSYSRSALHIATSPDPELNLLDMVVMVTLARTVVEDYWQPEVYGARADGMLAALIESEEDIWSIAGRVMTQAQQDELRELIIQWRKDHPDQQFVSFVRFASFNLNQEKRELLTVELPLGLLPEVDETTRAIDELRMAGERYLFFLEALPSLVRSDAKLFLMTILNEPRIAKFLEDTTLFREASERFADGAVRFADGVVALPQGIGEETRAALDDFIKKIDDKYETWSVQLTEEEARLHRVLADSRETMSAAEGLVAAVNGSIAAADNLVAPFQEARSANPDGKPFDIADYRMTAEEAGRAAERLDAAVQSLEKLVSSPTWGTALGRVFWVAAGLMLMFFAGLLGTLVLYRIIAQRLAPRN